MAVAARSQGKHKPRIWVNISLEGIKIIDEKTGVRNRFMIQVICFQYSDIYSIFVTIPFADFY